MSTQWKWVGPRASRRQANTVCCIYMRLQWCQHQSRHWLQTQGGLLGEGEPSPSWAESCSQSNALSCTWEPALAAQEQQTKSDQRAIIHSVPVGCQLRCGSLFTFFCIAELFNEGTHMVRIKLNFLSAFWYLHVAHIFFFFNARIIVDFYLFLALQLPFLLLIFPHW